MNETLSTRILIERIQGGDDTAKDELYSRFQLPVLFLVRVNLGRRLRSKLDSWDIVQETLVKSLSELENFRYEHDDAFRRFLSKKVSQVIRDHADFWSAAKRDPSREDAGFKNRDNENATPEIVDYRQNKSPSELLALDEDLSQLAEALDELSESSPDVWEVIVAVKIVGRSLRDVAEEHNSTPDAIKMKLRRGLLKLTKLIRKKQELKH